MGKHLITNIEENERSSMNADPHVENTDDQHQQTDQDFTNQQHHTLMPFKVREVLLVSSLYDAFILEEEGLISEMVIGEYGQLHLSSPPRFTRVPSGKEALKRAKSKKFDLVITMSKNIGMDPLLFSKQLKKIHPNLQVVLLATENADLLEIKKQPHHKDIDNVFFWNGDPSLFMAIIKNVEDSINVPFDTVNGNVQVLLFLEDSIRDYSLFLPIMYTELVQQTERSLSEDINEMQRLVRRRARPKILLATTFEEGMDLYKKYKKNILGVLSDVQFPKDGQLNPKAGYAFISQIKKENPYLPTLLQSSDPKNKEGSEAIDSYFLNKQSETLLEDFRRFLIHHLGFGDFVFLLPVGSEKDSKSKQKMLYKNTKEIGRAQNLQEFEELLKKIPLESIHYHANRNDFSNWLMSRGEFHLAQQLRPRKVSDFTTLDENRQYLIKVFNETRKEKQRSVISDFTQQHFEFSSSFTRLGGDSLGGKGRGIAFLRKLVTLHDLDKTYPSVNIIVPSTVVIGTEEFDRFVQTNELRQTLEKNTLSDTDIAALFLKAQLPQKLRFHLGQMLRHFTSPLAVRSSSLLEDSLNHPFAGIYTTYMLPNNHDDEEIRLEQLCQAIKLVYASVFYKGAQMYIESTSSKKEEEKMAVVIQEVIGRDYGGRFYPTFSGVAQSYNFYPVSRQTYEDGIVSIAAGLGKSVVDGGRVYRFCPKYPHINPDFSTAELTLENSQRNMYVIDTSQSMVNLSENDALTLQRLSIADVLDDDSFHHIISTYDPNDKRIRMGSDEQGVPLITFAAVMKNPDFPFANIVKDILQIGARGVGSPIEIEFAVDLDPEGQHPPTFALLQIRPLVIAHETCKVSWGKEETQGDHVFLYSKEALGNGLFETIQDIIYVPKCPLGVSTSVQIAQEIEQINQQLREKQQPYILIGPGRWGSQDPFLGIPVKWGQISGAKIIVETHLKDLHIQPSQGTHFFQNMISRGVGYISLPDQTPSSFLDADWLKKQETIKETTYTQHVHLHQPVTVKLDGRCGGALIHKPAAT